MNKLKLAAVILLITIAIFSLFQLLNGRKRGQAMNSPDSFSLETTTILSHSLFPDSLLALRILSC